MRKKTTMGVDHLGKDMRKVKDNEEEKEGKEIKGELNRECV